MEYAVYGELCERYAKSYVALGRMRTPVWQQQCWGEGEYAEFIVRNGCGHCCAAMALTMHGIAINPHGEYALCRELWGAPRELRRPDGTKEGQGNFQSNAGIVKMLRHHGVPAEGFGVPSQGAAREHIDGALRRGRLVIFESHPTADFPDNPFSTGEHWVMAVGYTEDGRVLVANSSVKASKTGVDIVSLDTVVRALYLGSEPDGEMTWGEWRDDFKSGTGYIVVG